MQSVIAVSCNNLDALIIPAIGLHKLCWVLVNVMLTRHDFIVLATITGPVMLFK
jgi:hypothetical protein